MHRQEDRLQNEQDLAQVEVPQLRMRQAQAAVYVNDNSPNILDE
jgi:hypothetical protein